MNIPVESRPPPPLACWLQAGYIVLGIDVDAMFASQAAVSYHQDKVRNARANVG